MGRRFRRLSPERPYVLTGAVVLAVAVVTVAAGVTRMVLDLPSENVELGAEVVLALLVAVVVTRMGWWRHVGFRRLVPLRDLRLFWIPLFPVLPALPAALATIGEQAVGVGGLGRLGFWLILAVLVAFVEEVAFRGLILRALAPRGVWRAAVISSVLFGLMHAVNLLFGAQPAQTLLQMGSATALGFGFAAVALRTGTLWPLVVIHALIDVAGFAAADGATGTAVTGTDLVVAAVYAVMFLGYGALVLRTVPRPPCASTATGRDHPVAGSPAQGKARAGSSM